MKPTALVAQDLKPLELPLPRSKGGMPLMAAQRRSVREYSGRPLPMQTLSNCLNDVLCRKNPLTLHASASVAEGCRLMREHRIGAVLVTDRESNLIGIFTRRDAVNRVLAEGKEGNQTKLAEVMTPNPITMSPNKTAIDALRLMWDGGFRHIPIVENRKLLGVISRGDFEADGNDRLREEREFWERLR
jgi:CBS domain-containing protein